MDQQGIAKIIENKWKSRAHNQGLKPKTKTYLTAQAHFFCGAMEAMHYLQAAPGDEKLHKSIPPWWVIAILSGRDITEEQKEKA